jgi:uncharacterized protein YacL
MGLKEQFEEFNKKPNVLYYYIAGIIIFLFTIGIILNPKVMGETISGIIAIIFWLIMCYFCFKFCGRNQQHQQQQQQQIVMQTGEKKLRVCPKCGMQNNVTNRFCSDCAYEFSNQND